MHCAAEHNHERHEKAAQLYGLEDEPLDLDLSLVGPAKNLTHLQIKQQAEHLHFAETFHRAGVCSVVLYRVV